MRSINSEKREKKVRRPIRHLVTLSLILLLLLLISYLAYSVIACNPPEIVSVTRFPEILNYDQSVTITAQVIAKTYEIKCVTLRYNPNNTSWIGMNMSLEDSQDSIYMAEIPAQPYNTKVSYKVYACDTHGYSSCSEFYSYVVGDFVPPVISDIFQVPTGPLSDEAVKVSTTVTEPPKASGVKNVTLWCTTDHVWSFLEMTLQDGSWSVTIPGQNEGVQVKYFIEAFDDEENRAQTVIFDYTVIIPNDPPIADFSESAEIVYTGESTDFDASESDDPDGIIIEYHWDFGDGTTGVGVAVSHAYTDDGSYNVILIVTDNEGATDSASATKTVLNRQPVASFTESAKIVYINQIITFNAGNSYDHDGYITDYFWDFGDGNTATGVSTSHSYSQRGTYIVSLTVTDDDGATDTASAAKAALTTIVPSQEPVASFKESAETVYTGEGIYFDASSSYDPDGIIIGYQWDFGDEKSGVGVEVDHAYEDDGIYTVTLTVIDDDGATHSSSSTKIILNRPPLATFTENATTVKTGETIYFDASASYDPDGKIVEYHWDFDDGTIRTGVTPNHMYSEVGDYTVTLTVTDDDGASASESAIKIVETGEETANGVLSLSFFAAIGLGVMALTITLLYGLLIRRKKKKKHETKTT